jgi:predicted transcriptional regulator
MAKTRVTFTIGPEDAERLRLAAEHARMTTSAFVERAVLSAVEREEAIGATFAAADAASAEAFATADRALWAQQGPLSDEDKAEIDAALDRFFARFPKSA